MIGNEANGSSNNNVKRKVARKKHIAHTIDGGPYRSTLKMDDIVSYNDNDDEHTIQTYITRSTTCCHANSSEYMSQPRLESLLNVRGITQIACVAVFVS